VRVTGFYNHTPLIEFLSKGSHIANLTGEKLSEYQVSRAVTESLRTLDLSLTSYSLAPCWDEELPYYGLFIEKGDVEHGALGPTLTNLLDQKLKLENTEYASKRDSQRLGPVRLELLPDGTWARWDRQRLARQGGSMEQYKHPCLIADPKFRDSLTDAITGQ